MATLNFLNLQKTSVKDLDVCLTNCDLRKDLHTFMRYARKQKIKRSHRTNDLPKVDARRLAKIMTDSQAPESVESDGYSKWIDYIDRLCFLLKFVTYDTEGIYAGYTSYQESYPENYIEVEWDRYEKFLTQSMLKQEEQILDTFLKDFNHCNNEFFVCGPKSRLDRFDMRGCATGVMPTIPFDKIRLHLLKLLEHCQSGVWYSTASFIDYLKTYDPFFLLPEKLPQSIAKYEKKRYYNFREHPTDQGRGETKVTEKDPDAFERVEGRFVERFLEGIPFPLAYVDVAYLKKNKKQPNLSPSINRLQAFRVTERLLSVMRRDIHEPRVTVLPNFEIHLDSLFYPAEALSKLRKAGDLIAEGAHTVLKLRKNKVAALTAEDSSADVMTLLKDITSDIIPANVQRELEGWVEHAEKFTLYDGFGLLEGETDRETADRFAFMPVTSGINIVRNTRKLYKHMEKAAPL